MLLEICLVGAFSTTNIFIFLFFFELSALPIFVLMAYCGSTRKERIKATYYFLFFTLYGSISLLLVLISYSVISFQLYQNSDAINDKVYYILLFISFAIKLPLFPFHI
jgi:NADH-quinone oxidoreductase subunit M